MDTVIELLKHVIYDFWPYNLGAAFMACTGAVAVYRNLFLVGGKRLEHRQRQTRQVRFTTIERDLLTQLAPMHPSAGIVVAPADFGPDLAEFIQWVLPRGQLFARPDGGGAFFVRLKHFADDIPLDDDAP